MILGYEVLAAYKQDAELLRNQIDSMVNSLLK